MRPWSGFVKMFCVLVVTSVIHRVPKLAHCRIKLAIGQVVAALCPMHGVATACIILVPSADNIENLYVFCGV